MFIMIDQKLEMINQKNLKTLNMNKIYALKILRKFTKILKINIKMIWMKIQNLKIIFNVSKLITIRDKMNLQISKNAKIQILIIEIQYCH